MKLVGYADRLSVAPGERVVFMVSSEARSYCAEIVQLIHGDDNIGGPGFKVRKVMTDVSGEYPGKYQRLHPGSYVFVSIADELDFRSGFSLHMWIWSTTPGKPTQTLISSRVLNQEGFAVRLVDGLLTVQLGNDPCTVTLNRRVVERTWYSVGVVFDRLLGNMRLSLEAAELTATRLSAAGTYPLQNIECSRGSDVFIGAECVLNESARTVGNFYNGKIDAPMLYNRVLCELEIGALRDGKLIPGGVLGAWDFSRDINSTRVTDVSGNNRHGHTVNRPTRAVVGHSWDGSEVVWTNAPGQYGAIHFHDDDLDDAGWEPSVAWTVPDGTTSGVYALHVHTDADEDYIPFAVRPKRGTATSDIAFLMPVFSYVAYGNSRMAGRSEVVAQARLTGVPKLPPWPSLPQDKYAAANRLNSVYDTHTDGSGCCYASWMRPIVSMRPKYLSEIMGVRVPHQLNADLHLVDWLVEQGYRFDVVTDENLHLEGRYLLEPYRVVLTGTHPEYWSQQMVRACQEYLHHGGRMMYVGGNGMYWVTQLDTEKGHTLEVRRVQPSTPHFFDPHPGELHLSTTGERAALWRHRGLPTQAWLGTVMSGSGCTGQHYVRRPASFDPKLSWIFDGIDRSELIGNFKNLHSGYGAAGGEVDRVEFRIEGTPHHTKVLATSERFDHTWVWDPVDPPNAPRSDLVLLEYPRGGAVFSVSSIAWCSCLSYNRYQNNVSRLTHNVLDGFLSRDTLLGTS